MTQFSDTQYTQYIKDLAAMPEDERRHWLGVAASHYGAEFTAKALRDVAALNEASLMPVDVADLEYLPGKAS